MCILFSLCLDLHYQNFEIFAENFTSAFPRLMSVFFLLKTISRILKLILKTINMAKVEVSWNCVFKILNDRMQD